MKEEESEANNLTEEMISKIYGFCRMKMNTQEDAEDLAQEICLEVLKAIHAGKQIENLNAFVWSVSNHIFFNWLRRQRRGSTAYLPDALVADDDVEGAYISAEEKTFLHRELSMMSGHYRKAVVMHYYDGMSCEEIGKVLGKSAGTVKWWLHDARKAIEKGMHTMRTYGEKSYRPGTLFMSCQGDPGANEEPMCCAKRKSAQNILLAAYQEPVTIEELCTELGIAAPYVEDEVEYLVENQLMKEVSKGKYQTDFVILSGMNAKLADVIYQTCFPAYYEKLLSFLEGKKELLTSEKYNIAHFSWERLLWVYIHVITDIATGKYKYDNNIHVKMENVPQRPNGGQWIALGYENISYPMRKTQEEQEYYPYDGPVHKSGGWVQGFFHYWSEPDSRDFFAIPDAVFDLCKEIAKGSADPQNLSEEEKYLFSIALEKKLFLKTDKGFQLNFYYVNGEEAQQIQQLAFTFSKEVTPYFQNVWNLVLQEYLPGVPKHLHWQMGNFLSNYLNYFVTCSLYDAVKAGVLSEPDENHKEWLSLFVMG